MNWLAASFFLASGLLASSVGPMGPDAPAREPQLAVRGSTVAMTFGAGHAIYFSQSTDSGMSFSPPVKVAESAIIPLTRHRGPRIAFAGFAIVITAVAGKTAAAGAHAHGLPSDGDLISWRSTDGGKTWSKGVSINDVPGAATEGLHGLGADAKGDLFAAWLDKRAKATKFYGSRSNDGGRTWSANALIYASPDGTICECCHPSVAFDSEGTILVMWRNWLGGSRDMYMARSSDGTGFSTPQRLGEGTWRLNACPMDGGGIAASSQGIITAWRRERTLFLDRPGERETAIGEGTDIAIAAGKSGIYTIWSTAASVELLAPGDKEARSLAARGSYPAVAALPAGGAIASWESDGRIIIQAVK